MYFNLGSFQMDLDLEFYLRILYTLWLRLFIAYGEIDTLGSGTFKLINKIDLVLTQIIIKQNCIWNFETNCMKISIWIYMNIHVISKIFYPPVCILKTRVHKVLEGFRNYVFC